jgi:hypothetical protein
MCFEQVKLVIKNTFVEFHCREEECPRLRRHNSDPLLKTCSELVISSPLVDKFMNSSTPTTCASVNDEDDTTCASVNDEDDNASSLSSPLSAEEELTADSRTTIVMRSIPNDYTRAMLMDLMDVEGFRGLYDFLYLPIDFESQATNCGYSFVNFVDSEVASRFFDCFSGFQRWSVQSDEVCELRWSDKVQGLDAHVELFRNSPVLHEAVPDNCKPVLFRDGERVAFPRPTKRVRAPRKGRCIRANRKQAQSSVDCGSGSDQCEMLSVEAANAAATACEVAAARFRAAAYEIKAAELRASARSVTAASEWKAKEARGM